jgi:hypothetical protein
MVSSTLGHIRGVVTENIPRSKEVIVFDTILTQEQLRTVEQYMQKKYGIV